MDPDSLLNEVDRV